MPDILIRGYSMPASCATCHFNNNMFCDVLGLKIKFPVDYIERPGACPLHELPPHGDLIDRDALLSRGKNNPFVDSEIYHPCVQTNCREIVMDEPVVVPAERREP